VNPSVTLRIIVSHPGRITITTLTIAIKPGNFDTAPALEGTLVHEGRHSWVQANVIAGFSNGSTLEDITQYHDEMMARDSAIKYFRRRGGEFTKFGQELEQLKSDGITVNQANIRLQIFHDYTSSTDGPP
jgi:hypothetical protein